MFMGLFLNCSKKSDHIQNPQDSVAEIVIVSGNNQIGQGNSHLPNPISVQIRNSSGVCLKDIDIQFKIVEGDGVVNMTKALSDVYGLVEISWMIGESYNAMQVSISDDYFEADPCYIYAQGDNPSGINKTKTINSLEKIGDNFYTITFYGDYSNLLIHINRRFGGGEDLLKPATSTITNYFCSLFSTFGNSGAYLFGRSFDNPADWECLTLLGRYYPRDGYASLALARMQDFGYKVGTDFDALSFYEKDRLLETAFFPPDGINEHGLVVGLAGVRELSYTPDYNKKSIFITYLVREILDHAKNVDEAAEIALKYNVFHPHTGVIACHALVADPSGRSIILEFHEKEMRVIPIEESWQVLTNSPVYNISIYRQKGTCWRYKTVYDLLNSANGNITSNEEMNILENVAFKPGTEWSAVYDMTNKKIVLAIDQNFSKLYQLGFVE